MLKLSYVDSRLDASLGHVLALTHFKWWHLKSLLLLLFALGSSRQLSASALDDYVSSPDGNYSFQHVSTQSGPDYTEYLLSLTSQRWLSDAEVDRSVWKHALFIHVPDEVRHSIALLRIGGRDNESQPSTDLLASLRDHAVETGTVAASLWWVPNQPTVFSGDGRPLREDSMIAYTFARYLAGDTSNPDAWPLLLPMVKSVVRAMDAVETFVPTATEQAVSVDKFVLTGVSKRGWTTWLTAAVDKRVVAIIPVVFDVLNMDEQMEHQRHAYENVMEHIVGGYAAAVRDYVNANVMQRLDTPAGKDLLGIVDPFEYRDRLTPPKYMLNATGDEFFLPDSAQFYFHELAGPKYLRYVPNAGHTTVEALAMRDRQVFYEAILNREDLPEFSWSRVDDATLRVETGEPPQQVLLWQTTNPRVRDFRVSTFGKHWTSSEDARLRRKS